MTAASRHAYLKFSQANYTFESHHDKFLREVLTNRFVDALRPAAVAAHELIRQLSNHPGSRSVYMIELDAKVSDKRMPYVTESLFSTGLVVEITQLPAQEELPEADHIKPQEFDQTSSDRAVLVGALAKWRLDFASRYWLTTDEDGMHRLDLQYVGEKVHSLLMSIPHEGTFSFSARPDGFSLAVVYPNADQDLCQITIIIPTGELHKP